MISYCDILWLVFYTQHWFLKAFYFEIIIDSREVAKLVQRVFSTLHSASLSGNILYNYSIIVYSKTNYRKSTCVEYC